MNKLRSEVMFNRALILALGSLVKGDNPFFLTLSFIVLIQAVTFAFKED